MQQDPPRAVKYVALTDVPDANGIVNGYGLAWNSGSDGRGIFFITKFSMSEAAIGTGTPGQPLGQAVASPVKVVTDKPTALDEFAVVTLTWNSSGSLTLSVNGKILTTTADSSYKAFSRLYVDGCVTGYFTDLTLVEGAEAAK